MAQPSRMELSNRQGKKKSKVVICESQYPECPEVPTLEHEECKHCLINPLKKKRFIL